MGKMIYVIDPAPAERRRGADELGNQPVTVAAYDPAKSWRALL
jgi:hypothetical protein